MLHTHENDLAQSYKSSLWKWHEDSGTHVELSKKLKQIIKNVKKSDFLFQVNKI